jgi:hypothetical protein
MAPLILLANLGGSLTFSCFSRSIGRLEQSLAEMLGSLEWLLVQELIAGTLPSRLYVAEVPQPLCTSVQIGLVGLPGCAGKFLVHMRLII